MSSLWKKLDGKDLKNKIIDTLLKKGYNYEDIKNILEVKEKMMNKIANLKAGDDSVLIEALINHVVSGKTNGAHRSTYLSMTLQDETGSIDAKLWNASDEQVQTLVKGSVVQIKGDVIKYNEDRQMKIVKIHLASQDDKERIKFLKQAPLDSQFMINEIKNLLIKLTIWNYIN